jgi:TolB-like protein/DNA-binding winged helix-turn-helix (wHTH) protein
VLYFHSRGGVPVSAGVFQFGEFELDSARFELFRAGRSVKVERMAMELLLLLVSKGGQLVTREQIAERLWPPEVFVDTEHGINSIIRKIRVALRDNPDKPLFVQTVTGKGYRFIAPITKKGETDSGKPTAHAPYVDDARRQEPSLTDLPSTMADTGNLGVAEALVDILGPARGTAGSAGQPGPRERLWIAALMTAAAVAVLAIGIWVHKRSTRSSAFSPHINSLAVLPLDNLSGDPDQEYFADGMTDELTTMLAKNSTLRITSRTSAMQYKGAHRPLREIAQALGVDSILEGSVARTDGKVHMTIQLIQAPTDTHLWAESYDRTANDVVALPTEAAQAVAKRLNSSVSVMPASRYVTPEAHDAYLHGRYLWIAGQNDKAGQYYKRATELQPDYALGWAGLGDYYGAGAVSGETDPRTALPAMDAAARKAVALDDSLARAHVTMGATYWIYNWDLMRADQEALRAVELDPSCPEAYHLRARIFAELNRFREAIEAERRANELAPFDRPWAMARVYTRARQYDAAISEAQLRLESAPKDPDLVGILRLAYQCKGRLKEAVQMAERCSLLTDDKASAEEMRRAFARGGYNAVLHWQISELERDSAKKYVSPIALANLYGQLGNRLKTLALLEESFQHHSPLMLEIQNDPAFDFLHRDERYRSLIRRIGLPPAY